MNKLIIIPHLAVRHWMGLKDEDIEGVWKWTNTDTITNFTDWEPSQPDGGRGSNCGIFWMETDFAWADEPCTNRKYQPICEKGMIIAHLCELS